MSWITNDLTYTLLQKACDASLFRHRVIAGNIANVDTPGFKARRVIFEEKLQSVMEDGFDGKEVRNVSPEIYIDQAEPVREDLNNVDIEKEMVRLSMNSLRYSIYTRLLDKKMGMIRAAIKGK